MWTTWLVGAGAVLAIASLYFWLVRKPDATPAQAHEPKA